MEFKVIQSKTWRWYVAVTLAILLAMFLSGWFAWHLSGEVRSALEVDVQVLTEQNQRLQNKILSNKQQLTELGRSEQMAKASVDQTGLNLSQMQQDKKQLEKELSFYRSIMAPELDKVGLNIQDLELFKIEDDLYDFSLTLTQVKKQDWYLKGSYKIELVSQVEGKEVKKTLAPMIVDRGFKPRFSFRYFQTLSSRFKLPKDIKPQAILVSAHTQDGKQRVSKRFPWTL